MKNKIKIIHCLLLLILSSKISFSQGPGKPYNPMTAYGAEGIGKSGHILYWKNPKGTIYNQVFLSSDSNLVASLDTSVMIYNGYPSTTYSNVSLNAVGLLDPYKIYYWRVVEFASNGNSVGPIWYFRSRIDRVEMQWLNDDFSGGTQNWIITNDGGTCVWEVFQFPYPNFYTLPCEPNCDEVLAADADECGSGTTTLTTARIKTPINTLYHSFTEIEWDNDWNALNLQDSAFVEFSEDGQNTWHTIWDAIGNDIRNSHEVAIVNSYSENVFIRFRTVQPGWDWWWAIDNVKITGYGPLASPREPNLLKGTSDSLLLKVYLNWDAGNCYVGSLSGYELQRKDGLPTDTSSYITLTVTDPVTFTYVDESVMKNHIYTYRIRTVCGSPGNASFWGNEATAYVPDIITSVQTKNELPTNFSLEQNYPNPFNPTTIIKFTIPTSPLNPSPYQGEGQRERLITLIVYDVLGNEISTLVNEEKQPGTYEVEFDSRNLIYQIPSGVYFYQLKATPIGGQAGNFVETKKMLLIK